MTLHHLLNLDDDDDDDEDGGGGGDVVDMNRALRNVTENTNASSIESFGY
jgi:hypothetical protein